jgi:hypothetical protein
MQDAERRIDALAYSLGWVLLIVWTWATVAWAVYLGRIAGIFRFVPDEWWPPLDVYMIFLGAVKLMVVGLGAAWLGVLLYRRRLRRA